MAKASYVTLPVLAALVLVAAGIVFATSSLTDNAIYFQTVQGTILVPSQQFTTQIQNITYLYPVNVSSFGGVTDARNAVFNNATSYAVLGDSIPVTSSRGFIGYDSNGEPGYTDFEGTTRDCPYGSEFLRIPAPSPFVGDDPLDNNAHDIYGSDENSVGSAGNYPADYCSFTNFDYSLPSFRRSANFTGWINTTNVFRTLTGYSVSRPTNITAIQINISEQNLGCNRSTSCVHSAKVVIFAQAKRMGGHRYIWLYLGDCLVSNDRVGVTCVKNFASEDYASSKWQVNKLVIGRKYALDGYPDPAVHWVRLVQNNN